MPSVNFRRRTLLLAVLLGGVTLAAYWPALTAGFIWDDDTFLTQNPLIHAADGLRRFWFSREAPDYWPVTSTTLWLEWRLWGPHATGYHVTNVILHIAEALLLWRILGRLRMPGAYLAAFLFAVHPINVESVAWITQRKNLMALGFFLLTVACFLRTGAAAAPAEPPVPPAEQRRWSLAGWVLFTLGMLSKGSVALLPIVLLGLIAWRRRPSRRDVASLLPYFAIAVGFTLVDIWFQKHGSAEVVRNAGPTERLLGAGAVVWFYLYKILWPLNLIFVYPQWHIDPGDFRWWLAPGAALGLTAVFWRFRHRWSRPPLFAWAYFTLMLVPVMGLTDIYFMKFALVADHYAHLALIGVLGGAAAAWARWRNQSGLAPYAAAGCVAALALLTRAQAATYRDIRTLYETTLARNPGCWLVQSNLALVLTDAGDPEDAIAHGREAIRLKPDLPEAHYNLGRALARAGQPAAAIAQYEAALILRANYPEARYNWGNALRTLGRLPEAIDQYGRALALKPDLPGARGNRASLLALSGRLPEALTEFGEALRLDPEDAQTRSNFGLALAQSGRLSEAIAQFSAALRIQPDLAEAHNGLGMALADSGRLPEALAEFAQAVRLNPTWAEAHANFSLALQEAGRTDEAAAQAAAADRLRAKQPGPAPD